MPSYHITTLSADQMDALVARRLTTGEAVYMRRFLMRVGFLPQLISRKAERWLAARIFDDYFLIYLNRFTNEKSKAAYLKEGFFIRVNLAHAALARLDSIRAVTDLYRISRVSYTALVRQGGTYPSQPGYTNIILGQIGSHVVYDVKQVVFDPLTFDNRSEDDDFDGPATVHPIPPLPMHKKRTIEDFDGESAAGSEHDFHPERRSSSRVKRLKEANYVENDDTDDGEDDGSETNTSTSHSLEKTLNGMVYWFSKKKFRFWFSFFFLNI